MRTLPDSITLGTPEGWSDFPIDPSDFGEFRAHLLKECRGTGDLKRSDERALELFVTNLHRKLQADRVLYIAGIAELVREDETAEPELFSASVAVSTVSRAEIGVDAPLLADVLVKVFGGDSELGDDSIKFDDIEPPSKVTVAGLEAVRLVRLLRSAEPSKQDYRQFCETFLFPVAEGDGVVLLQFATLNLEFAKQFSEVFGQVAQTLKLLYPEDATPLGEHAFNASGI